MDRKGNQMLRFLLLIVFVAIATVGMYFIPSKLPALNICGFNLQDINIENVDILSDIRPSAKDDFDDIGLLASNNISKNKEVAKKTTSSSDTDDNDSGNEDCNSNVEELNFYTSDSVVRFIDFSSGRNAFERIKNSINSNKKIRIAFLGDSFIEGDVFTEGVRSGLQREYGGSGTGVVPLSSNISGFRNSVNISGSNWNVHSLLKKGGGDRFAVNGEYYTTINNAKTTITLPNKTKTSNAILYYRSVGDVEIYVACDNKESKTILLPQSENINQIKINDSTFNKISINLNHTQGFASYGLSLENDNSGVIVDCFSIRGHSGLLLSSIDREINNRFLSLRDYDLIVFEYGLNVVNKNQKDYSGYRQKMQQIINKIKGDSPNSQIMIMGVSDRCVRENGDIHTMTSIYNLEKEQLIMAKETKSMFWSTRLAMKRLGGMANLSKLGLADKDYTHLGHKGGSMLSKEWVKSFKNKLKE